MRAALYIISTTVQRRGIADLHLCMYVLYSERKLPTYVSRNTARSGNLYAPVPMALLAPFPSPVPVLVSRECGTGGGGRCCPVCPVRWPCCDGYLCR